MSNLERIRQLGARAWKPVVSLLVGAIGVVNTLKAAGVAVGDVPAVGTTPVAVWLFIASAAFIIVIVRFPRVGFGITRLILGNPSPLKPGGMIFRGPFPFKAGDELPGRHQDLERCLLKIDDAPFFILEGESGCGKSSFLNALLLPCLGKKYDVIECRIAKDPFGTLRDALSVHGESFNYSVTSRPDSKQAISETLKSRNSAVDTTQPSINRPILVCIDQFEELFTTVEPAVRSSLLGALKSEIECGKLRMMIVMRSDFSDLLMKLILEVDPEMSTLHLGDWYTLRAFREDEAEAVLDELLAPMRTSDVLVSERLRQFRTALVRELLRPTRDKRLCDSHRTVLPVELQIVGWMIELSGRQGFSPVALRSLGGKYGLFRSYIEKVSNEVWRKTGVEPSMALLILRQLVSLNHTRCARTAGEIADIPQVTLSSKQVERVLNAFAQSYIVGVVLGENEPTPANNPYQYELIHEYLIQIMDDAPDPRLQKIRDAEEGLRFWIARLNAVNSQTKKRWHLFDIGLASIVRQHMPMFEILRLWRFAGRAERRLLLNSLGILTLKFVAILIILAVTVRGWTLWTRSDAYQIRMIISDARLAETEGGGIPSVEGPRRINLVPARWLEAMGYLDKVPDALAAVQKIRPAYTRDRLLEALVQGLVTTNKTDSALLVLTEIQTPYYRIGAATKIAEALNRLGRSDLAAKALEEALIAAHGASGWNPAPDHYRTASLSELMVHIADVWIAVGRYDQAQSVLADALDAARRNPFADYREFAALSGAFNRVGIPDQADRVFKDALAAARGVKNRVIEAHPGKNRPTISLPDPVPPPTDRQELANNLTIIAQTLGDRGDQSRALAAIGEIEDTADRLRALASVSSHFIEIGKVDQANRFLDEALIIWRSSGAEFHQAAARDLCKGLYKAGRQQEALNIVHDTLKSIRSIKEPTIRRARLGDIDLILCEINNPLEAMNVASGRRDDWGILALAKSFARIGAEQQALSLMRNAEHKVLFQYVMALVEITEDLFAAGGIEKATESADEALTSARNVLEKRALALAAVAEILGRIGRTHEAVQVANEALREARETQGDGNRSSSFAAVAKTFARLGSYRDARLTANECAFSTDQIDAYTTILIEFAAQNNPALAQPEYSRQAVESRLRRIGSYKASSKRRTNVFSCMLIASQISFNSSKSSLRSPDSYLLTNDCGRPSNSAN